MRILFISCLLWTILFTRQVKGESKCLRTNRQPDRMCVTKCDPLTGCRAEEKCLCDGDCGYSCVKRDLSCGRPPRVSNARPQYPATNFSSVVTYVCNEGHTLSGAAKRTCRANGRWDGVGPNCLKMCSLPTIPFSTYIAKPVNFTRKYRTGERITLACKKGFKKKPGGNPVRICISGLWTRFPFQCEGTHACKRTIRAPRTKCTQECSPQSGCDSDKYKCLCDGSCGFSCVEIGMSCGNPPSISNGNLVYNNTSYNSTAHYSCNEGYNLNTAPVKRCTAKKRWEGLTPRCLKDCKPPAIPRNANISNPSKKYHSGYKVTFKCNEGYNQEGMATQMCFLGSWTVLPFKCTEGGCGDPGTPENGRKLGVTYSVNSKVYFDCDLGYELEGSADRKCQLNGTWTGIQPVCKAPLCDKPNIPDEAAVIYPRSMDREFKYGDRVLLKCKEGYFKSGLGVYQCKKGNRWSGGITCSPKNCGRPNDIPNGKFIGYVYSFKEKIRYECNEGYNLKGPSYRTCQANEKWGDKDPICEVVDCGPLQKPDHGDIIEQVAFTYGNRIVFDCTETGYEMKGSRVRTCLSDGTWSGSLTTCEAPCARPTIPVNGKVVGNIFSHGKSVNFYCDSGYKRVGARSIKCDDGKWDKPSPVCKGICSTPRDPQNGKLHQKVPPERFLDGDEAKFFCNSGYDLIGKKKLRCVGKVWDSSEPECKAMSCGNPPSITNGNVVYNDTSYNSTAHYTCNEGYSLNTAPVKRCTSKKRWEGLTPRCLQDCKPPTIPINARISNPSNKYHSGYKVTFKCNEGYNQEGMATQMCFLGSWTVLPFKCTGACNAVLGMHNKKIQDSSITASSQLSLNHVPSLARLDSVQGAWCSAPTDNLPYIEILLSEEKFLTLIKTQGSKKDLRWATKYEIQYQKDGQWIVYRKTDGTRTFDGNVGVTSLNAIALQPRIRTRSVRIYPKFPLSLDGDASLMNVSCLRLELYGCSAPVDGLWGA